MKLIITVCFCVLNICSFSQIPDWAFARNGAGNAESVALDVAKDDSGNIYVCGYVKDCVSFDSQKLFSTGGKDIFIVKHNSGVTCYGL